jgi:hypothetical protein
MSSLILKPWRFAQIDSANTDHMPRTFSDDAERGQAFHSCPDQGESLGEIRAPLVRSIGSGVPLLPRPGRIAWRDPRAASQEYRIEAKIARPTNSVAVLRSGP